MSPLSIVEELEILEQFSARRGACCPSGVVNELDLERGEEALGDDVVWTNDLFEYHGEFADFDRCGFGAKPIQKPHPAMFFSGLKDPKRSASRIAKYGLSGWIGIQDTPDELKQWRGAIQRGLEELGSSRAVDG